MRRTGRIARFTGRGRRGRSAELERGEFGAGAEAELAEHVAQVEVDSTRAEEQLCGGVPVGQALPNERGDLPLLGSELGRGGDVAAAGGFAGGAQLLRGARGPPRGAEVVEYFERGAQVGAGIDPAAGAAQVLAVAEVDARPVEPARGGASVLDRLLELLGRVRVIGQQGASVCGGGTRPARLDRHAELIEFCRPVASQVGALGADGGLGELPVRDVYEP